MVDAFVQFCTDVAMEQTRYERRGNYGQRTYDDVYQAVYGADTMAEYLWGAYLTNFLWPHHLEIAMIFRDRFVARLDDDARIVELAPGAWPLGRVGVDGAALTAAHTDHITEFRRESELVVLAENHGLRVLETYSGSPGRTLPDARFLPRSMALLVQKRANNIW